MRALALAAVLVLVPAAAAHPYSEHGNVTFAALGFESAILPLYDSLAPEGMPNGVFAWRIASVEGGDAFHVAADDGVDCGGLNGPCLCGGDAPPTDHDNGTPAGGTPLDKWVDPVDWFMDDPGERNPCAWHPDFDVQFSGGPHPNAYGDEAGVVPGDGDAIVVLFYGDPGEGFTYREA